MSVSGTDPLQYEWQSGGVTLGTNAPLTLSNVQPLQAGNYYLIARNAFGVVTSSVPIALIVQFAPVINSQPRARTIATSSPLTLLVSASGNPAPSFQWLRNGAALSNGGTVSGADSAALSISSFEAADAGLYQVRVTNALGETNSSIASIQLASPLRIGGYTLAPDGSFDVQLIGPAEMLYELECSTNLVTWSSLGTNYSFDGFVSFRDAEATNHLHRFYRTKTLP